MKSAPMNAPVRRIWLCADDYGMAPGINAAIRELIAGGRLNATSVMMPVPHIGRAETDALMAANAGDRRAQIGLHVTLTAPFAPMSAGFAPLRGGAFLPHRELMQAAVLRRLKPEALTREIAAQMSAFIETFGRAPDFVDGHQHVQLLPQVRDAFLKVTAELAPNAWVRQCGRARRTRRLHDSKALVLDILSMGFRGKAAHQGLATNPAFAGAYAFTATANFPDIFPRFLAGLPDGGLIMCHPGYVDDALMALDPLTTLRERELDYFRSGAFPRLLTERGFALASPTGDGGKAP